MSEAGAETVATAPAAAPGAVALFVAFSQISLSGFGGVVAWAHRSLVHERRWLSEQEFIEMLGLCQILPGPNIGNLSIYVGAHFGGWRGALAAFAGLMTGPFVIILVVAELYRRYGNVAGIRGALLGVSAASAGMLLAMAGKMAWAQRRNPLAIAFALAAFAAIGLLRLPLPLVLLVLAPLSIAAFWLRGR